jgi:hypothetical protein
MEIPDRKYFLGPSDKSGGCAQVAGVDTQGLAYEAWWVQPWVVKLFVHRPLYFLSDAV